MVKNAVDTSGHNAPRIIEFLCVAFHAIPIREMHIKVKGAAMMKDIGRPYPRNIRININEPTDPFKNASVENFVSLDVIKGKRNIGSMTRAKTISPVITAPR
ncbi:hypothetical protein RvVAR0630_12850 [Agrobacterium vitis]|nr:hypothetical protein RvVAR0630_12850 [Agrobacterium vitis]